ncbi:hypothetical protein T12_8371 [Trichinella patagoniensis]|uniref:Uncharacterized protein n=1 Tax=Trichinella patagoniensis TaxID=990121 RepID=A0A0V0ZCG2_9BILA|nr:hypothetical protein T12_8371 [Trichinella patagoniensis]
MVKECLVIIKTVTRGVLQIETATKCPVQPAFWSALVKYSNQTLHTPERDQTNVPIDVDIFARQKIFVILTIVKLKTTKNHSIVPVNVMENGENYAIEKWLIGKLGQK